MVLADDDAQPVVEGVLGEDVVRQRRHRASLGTMGAEAVSSPLPSAHERAGGLARGGRDDTARAPLGTRRAADDDWSDRRPNRPGANLFAFLPADRPRRFRPGQPTDA